MAHTFTDEDRKKGRESANYGRRGKSSRTWARQFIERYCEDNDPDQVAEAAKHVLTISDNVKLSDKHLQELSFQRHILNLQLTQKIHEYQAKKWLVSLWRRGRVQREREREREKGR